MFAIFAPNLPEFAMAFYGVMLAGDRVHIRGLVGDASGTLLRAEIEGDAADADALGIDLAERLIKQGAGAMLEAAG